MVTYRSNASALTRKENVISRLILFLNVLVTAMVSVKQFLSYVSAGRSIHAPRIRSRLFGRRVPGTQSVFARLEAFKKKKVHASFLLVVERDKKNNIRVKAYMMCE